jgi:hypothetical protein
MMTNHLYKGMVILCSVTKKVTAKGNVITIARPVHNQVIYTNELKKLLKNR